MKNLRENKRKFKRKLNCYVKSAQKNRYFVGCNYHICEMTEVGFSSQDLYGGFIDGKSKFDGSECSCSIFHCSPKIITKEQAKLGIQVFNESGFEVYIEKFLPSIYTEA
jgi:hypothetical protein